MRETGALLAGLAALSIFATSANAAGGDAPAYLPDPKCAPVDLASDDAENAFQPPEAAVVKVVYAHPSDFPSRFGEIAPIMARGVREAMEFLYLESDEAKSIRYDLGTAAGPDCVDVQHVALPGTAATYVNPTTGAGNSKPIVDDLQPLLGPQPGTRVYLVYVEIENKAAGGLAPLAQDDSVVGAAHQAGDRFAVVFNPVLSDVDPRYIGQNGTHELFHLFGAVQSSAPNAGANGHCNDGDDLMCLEGGACPTRSYPTTILVLALDCNGDDYFNPSPAPGSYLATHWNTYDSQFLCAVGSCAPDNVSPKTTAKGPKRTGDRTPKFRLLSDERGTRFECKLDRGKTHGCDSRFVAPKLDPGKHRLAVAAIDAAGNVDASPEVVRFKVVG